MTRTTAAVLALGSALTLAACSGHSSAAPSATGTSSSSAPATSQAAATGSTSASGSASAPTSQAPATTSAPSKTPATTVPATATSPGSKPTTVTTTSATSSTRCTNSQLKVALGTQDNGAGQIYTPIVFTNIGSTMCTLVGHPGVSYVAGDDGHQVGASAVRTGAAATVSILPGKSASALLHETNYSNFDAGTCKPVKVRGLRIYPPGSKAAVFIPRVTTQCSATTLPDPALSIAQVKAS